MKIFSLPLKFSFNRVFTHTNFEAFPSTRVKTAVIKLSLLHAIFNVYTLLPHSRNKPFTQEGSLTTDFIILQIQGGIIPTWPGQRKHLV